MAKKKNKIEQQPLKQQAIRESAAMADPDDGVVPEQQAMANVPNTVPAAQETTPMQATGAVNVINAPMAVAPGTPGAMVVVPGGYGATGGDPHLNLIAAIPGIRIHFVPKCCYAYTTRRLYAITPGTLAVPVAAEPMSGLLYSKCCENALRFDISQNTIPGIQVIFKKPCCGPRYYEVSYHGVRIGTGHAVESPCCMGASLWSDGPCRGTWSIRDESGNEVFRIPEAQVNYCFPNEIVEWPILDPSTKVQVARLCFRRPRALCCPDPPFVCLEFLHVSQPYTRLLLMSAALPVAATHLGNYWGC